MKNLLSKLVPFLVFVFLFGCRTNTAHAQTNIQPVFTLPGLAELQARYGGLDDSIQIWRNQNGAPLSRPRTLRRALIATNAVDGVHCVTNRAGTKYVSDDRFSAIQEAEWFGAVGDGSTDSSAAIRAAIQYCVNNGRPGLRFGSGTFLTDGVTNVGSGLIGGIAILGAEGQRTILRARSAGTVLRFANMRAAIIRDLWIDGNGVGTRGIVLSNCTHFTIQKCDIYNLAGKGIEFVGDNNYGHVIDQCNVQNCSTEGVHLNGVSTSAITVRDSTFQANAYSTNAYGIRVSGGSVNIRYRDNVFQSLKSGILLDGAAGSLQKSHVIKGNYFEVCSDDSIHFGAGQVNSVVIEDNYLYTDYTTNQWAVRSDPGSIIFGLTWKKNGLTTDSSRGLCLTNSLVRGWNIDPDAVDIATDYQLPDNATVLMSTPSQRLVSVLVTNYNAASSTNFQIAGDLLPNFVSLSASSNIAFQIVGSLYRNTDLTLRNTGTNVILFPPTGHLVRPGTQERFVAANGTWYRETGPYLRDSGGDIYGTLNITNDLNVYQNSLIYGGLTVNGVSQQPWGYSSSGTYGSTNIHAVGAKTGAMLGLIKDGFYYVFIGTNGVTRFTTAIETVAATNVVTHLAGFTNDPAAGIQRQHAIALTNLANLLGVSAGGGGTNRYVEQSINATNSPITINGALETTYVFTGAQDSSSPRYYYLPTNNVPVGALLHVVLQGTNTWTHWPLQYYFVDRNSSTTNRIYDNNRLDYTWSGTRWVKHGLSDWILPPGSDGLFYGWFNGGPAQIPLQSDAPFDGLEYVRKNQAWAVASGGGGGGGTNHNALAGLQGGTAGEYYHLSSNNFSALTGSGDTTLHFHSADRNRANHTGTQLTSTISDFSTNVWLKILSSLLRGNGIHFATNGPSNLLTISGWNLPGSNLSAVTNGDGSITWSATVSSATNGTPLSVNGGSILSLANLLDTVITKFTVSGSNITLVITNLQQSAVSNLVADLAAKQAANTNLLQIATAAGNPGDILYRHASGVLTNLPVGSSGHVLTVASGAPAWQAASGGGGGGNGTNLFVNGVLRQPARLTNSPTVVWATNAAGDIFATATNAAGTTAEVMQRIGWIKFDLYTDGGTDPVQSAWSNYVQNVEAGGVVTNAYLVGGPTALVQARYSGGIDVQINLPLSGAGSTNFVVVAQPVTRIATNNAYASTFVDVLGGSLTSTNIPLIVGTTPNTGFSLGASNTPNYHRWTNSYYVTVLAPTVVGGSTANVVSVNGSGSLTNLASGPDISFSTTGGTTATPVLANTAVLAGEYDHFTVDSKGRLTAATMPWESPWIFSECCDLTGVTSQGHSTYPWGLYALNGGTILSMGGVTNHPCIFRILSATGTLSGQEASFRASAMMLEQGAECSAIFRPLSANNTNTVRFGWFDSTTPNSANNAVFVEFSAGNISGRSNVGSTTPTITASTNAFSQDVWYRAYIAIGPDSNRTAVFRVIESDTGNVVWTNLLSSIPARTVPLGHAFMAFVNGAPGATTNIADLDWIGMKPGTSRR